MNILFVCTGNICRSYAAEMMAQKLLPNHFCKSVGTTRSGNRSRSGKVKEVLLGMGYSCTSGKSISMTEMHFDWADKIFYMDCNNLKRMCLYFGYSDKYKLLVELIGGEAVFDPYKYKRISVYWKCCRIIERAIKRLGKEIERV